MNKNIAPRQQERIENYNELSEEQKHLAIRPQIVEHNKSLAETAHNTDVNQCVEYVIFLNHGYMGLYGGITDSIKVHYE